MHALSLSLSKIDPILQIFHTPSVLPVDLLYIFTVLMQLTSLSFLLLIFFNILNDGLLLFVMFMIKRNETNKEIIPIMT